MSDLLRLIDAGDPVATVAGIALVVSLVDFIMLWLREER